MHTLKNKNPKWLWFNDKAESSSKENFSKFCQSFAVSFPYAIN